MSSINTSTVHIHGSGYAPLLVAVSLQRAFPALGEAISVSIAPSTQALRAIVSFSDMVAFNRQLKIGEQSFMKSCRASFHLATHYSGAGDSQFFSDSAYGAMIDRVNFHQLYHVYSAEHQCAYDEFCLAAALAKKNRFARASEQKNSPFNALNYGYQFDAAAYCQSLLAAAKSLGIQVYEAQVDALDVRAGQLQTLTMSGGLQQRAKVFIDCSASRDIVRHTHPAAVAIDSIPAWQRQDLYRPGAHSALPSASELQFDLPHNTIAKMASLRTGQYQSLFRFSASDSLSSSANRLPQSWCNNTLALGEACAQLPNLLMDVHYLLQRQLLQLSAMGALIDAGEGIKQLFNRTCEQSLEQLEDIDNIHIARLLADNQLLTSRNQQRVALFESAGSLYEIDNPILSAKHWLVLLLAMGFKQQAVDIEVLRLTPAQINQQLTALRAQIVRASEYSVSHEQWLTKAGV